jgi:DNA-binding FadR family transcriptional regulator
MMERVFKPLTRPAPLHHSVQEAIRAFILEHNLRAGDALPPETDLARQLAVSRNSVREAVKALESLGVLEARRGSGLFVREFSFAPLLENLSYGLLFDLRELAELLEIRRVLETGLIGATIQAMPEETLAALLATVTRMGTLADQGDNFAEEDRQFHQILFEPLGNRMLLKLLDIFWRTYQEASRQTDMGNPDLVGTYRDHLAIYDAVRQRNVGEARQALDQHYAGITKRLATLQAQFAASTAREDKPR